MVYARLRAENWLCATVGLCEPFWSAFDHIWALVFNKQLYLLQLDFTPKLALMRFGA